MSDLHHLFEKNRTWAASIKAREPEFFASLAKQQSPEYPWIGCADSRVPANQITGLMPGEVFVHRNIANVVVHSDMNCLSVIQFAVEVLKVKHIMVVGHYGCGGVRAAMDDQRVGLVTNWLRNVQDVAAKHSAILDPIADPAQRADRLCELNAIEQALNVCQTTVVREAWTSGQELTVHAWVYSLVDGLLRDLHISVAGPNEVASAYVAALGTVRGK